MTTTQDSAVAEAIADPYQFYRKNLLPISACGSSILRPGRVVFDTLWCWCGIVAAWVAVALWPTWWVVLLALPVIGTRYYALFIIGHDGLHRRLFAALPSTISLTTCSSLAPLARSRTSTTRIT